MMFLITACTKTAVIIMLIITDHKTTHFQCVKVKHYTGSVVSMLPELFSLAVQQVIYNYFNGLFDINKYIVTRF